MVAIDYATVPAARNGDGPVGRKPCTQVEPSLEAAALVTITCSILTENR